MKNPIFYPIPWRISQSGAEKAVAYSAVTTGRILESLPPFITSPKFSRPKAWHCAHHFLFSSVKILRMKNKLIVSNSTFWSLNLMQTSKNFRNSDGRPETVEKRKVDLCHVQMILKLDCKWSLVEWPVVCNFQIKLRGFKKNQDADCD